MALLHRHGPFDATPPPSTTPLQGATGVHAEALALGLVVPDVPGTSLAAESEGASSARNEKKAKRARVT